VLQQLDGPWFDSGWPHFGVCARFFDLCKPAMAPLRKHRNYARLWLSSRPAAWVERGTSLLSVNQYHLKEELQNDPCMIEPAMFVSEDQRLTH
jgi:hypothetical protein